jgi:hypothetical protein
MTRIERTYADLFQPLSAMIRGIRVISVLLKQCLLRTLVAGSVYANEGRSEPDFIVVKKAAATHLTNGAVAHILRDFAKQ